MNLYILIGLLALLISLYYLLLILPTIWVKIERIDRCIGLNMKILQISDMHMERLRVRPEKIKKIIKKEKPHYIFLTGDYMDEVPSYKKLEKYLKVIKDSGVKTYAVLGNHDYRLPSVDVLIRRLENSGIKVLRNESIEFEGFNLIGIDDYCTGHHNISKSFEKINQEKKRIVITHDPNIVLPLSQKYDYLMSGHLHGKQFNIPFMHKFINMGEIPNRGIWSGLHKTQWGTYYISKGLGQSGFNMRFLVKSEVTVHKL